MKMPIHIKVMYGVSIQYWVTWK